MKNYYLKRIDELKTDVTSGRPSKSVTTLLRTTAGSLIPKAARKLTKLRLKARGSKKDS